MHIKFLMLFLGVCCLATVLCSPAAHRLEKREEDIDEDAPNDEADDDYEGGTEEDDEVGPPPMFKSKPLEIEAKEGESILLPCDTINGDNYVNIWYKNKVFLYQDSIAATSRKEYTRFTNRTLLINPLSLDDSANFTCKILSDPPIELIHTIIVKQPPKVLKVVSLGSTHVDLNMPLSLKCEVTGSPKPKIIWSKAGEKLQESYEEVFNIAALTKHDGGTYQCMADNGVGDPAHGHVSIHVRYEPSIRAEKRIVSTAENYTSELICIVHANPQPIVEWVRNNTIITPSTKYSTVKINNSKYALTISKTQVMDFGEYKCVAKNILGEAHDLVLLTGAPTTPKFVKGEVDAEGRNPILIWSTESVNPIVEYVLEYKKVSDHEWTAVKDFKIDNPVGNIHTLEYRMVNLEPAAYEARLQARNTHGWSEKSTPSEFSGEPAPANISQQSTDGASSLQSPYVALVMMIALLSRLCVH